MSEFKYEYYIKRNEEIARQRYGDRIDKCRNVVGTDIWFDECWRIHTEKRKENE